MDLEDITMNLGVLSLLPIVVLFVFIFTTKRMLLSLTLASLTGAVLLGGINFASVWLDNVQLAFTKGTVGYLFLLLALFGILIQLLDKSGAAIEFANWLSRFAKTRRRAMILTFILGWIIFVDDYLNNMAVSTAMKRVCDKHKIPRTLFGFLVNCTAAPVCILIPFSTWAAFYSGLFEEYGVTVNGTGIGAYYKVIPYLFYAWFLLIICLLLIIGIFPLLGITKKDNELANETGVICTAERNLDGVELRAESAGEGIEEGKNNPVKFLLPMAVIIVLTVITENVMAACMGSILITILIILKDRKLRLTEIFDASYEGVVSMAQICCVIALSLTLVEINAATGMSDFVVSILTPLLSKGIFSALVFAFCSVYTYFVGGFWDGSMIFMPIVLPIATALGMDPLLPCAALICAATLGSTTYVAGDAIMITSRAVDIKPYYQMLGTLPYALISFGLSVVAFLITGFVIG